MFDGVLFGSVLRDLTQAWRRRALPAAASQGAAEHPPARPTPMYGRRTGLEAECVEDGVLAVRQHLFDPGIHAYHAQARALALPGDGPAPSTVVD